MNRAKRKLSAILCADVAHYSRLMAADEDGTLGRLKLYREAIGGIVAGHDGRVVNTWGDAIIIEFPSVVEAVLSAVEIQTDLAGRNDSLPVEKRMSFRIGLNLGDIMVEGEDIYGDGVNVAARLQEVAEPGGIVISASVFEQVRSKLALGFSPLGPQRVKNISEPVESFRIRIGGRNEPDEGPPADPEAWPEAKPGRAGNKEAPADRPVGEAVHGAMLLFGEWFRNQGRMIKISVVMIAFFFVINMMASPGTLWFQWPSLPFILLIAFSQILRYRPK